MGTAEQKVAAHNNRFDLTRPLSSFLLTFPYLILEKAPVTRGKNDANRAPVYPVNERHAF